MPGFFRRAPMVLTLLILSAAQLLRAAPARAGASPAPAWAAILANPASNVPEEVPVMCNTGAVDNSPACIQSALHDINHARALEAVKPMILPAAYPSLPVDAQVMVVANLERRDRGLAPWGGLNTSLNANAIQGAQVGYDPTGIANSSGIMSTGGQVLWADYVWMYQDGWDLSPYRPNQDCTSPTDALCWMHRDIIVGNFAQSCPAQAGCAAMGAGTANSPTGFYAGTQVITAVFVPVDAASLGAYPVDAFSNGSVLYPTSAPPQLMSVSGSPAPPGTKITVHGLYLSGPTSVTFGGVPAGAVAVTDDGSLEVVVPGAGPGSAPVSVRTAAGVSNSLAFSVDGSDRGRFTNPVTGTSNADLTLPFTWARASDPTINGYYLRIGTTQGGSDLFNSGTLGATTTSYPVARGLPTGRVLWARLFSAVNGVFSRWQDVSFTAAPGQATFTRPANGTLALDTTLPFTWSSVSGAGLQGYYLRIGTSPGAGDLMNSGLLAAGVHSYLLSQALPAGPVLWARLFTEMSGGWARIADVSFTVAPGSTAAFIAPLNGASGVARGCGLAWSVAAGAGVSGYTVRVGTTQGAGNLATSALLARTQTRFQPPAPLPASSTLWARITTALNGGGQRQEDISFTTGP